MDRSVHELRDEFFRLLDRPGDRAERWPEVWQLFVEHPWYQHKLHRAAERVVQRSYAPPDWAQDIEQEAAFLFGQHLKRAIDLHINRALAEERFAGWLATIIDHDCTTALRLRLHAQHHVQPLPRGYDVAEPRTNFEALIDIRAALKRLPAPMRAIVTLYSRGWSLGEISARLSMSYWKTTRLLHAGLARLARIL